LVWQVTAFERDNLRPKMICHYLQDAIGIHDSEVLEDLKNLLAATLEFANDFLVLQVVNEVLLFDERQ
jgi:hypothetical protein